MDGGAWWAAVHGVAKSRTWLSDFTLTFHFHKNFSPVYGVAQSWTLNRLSSSSSSSASEQEIGETAITLVNKEIFLKFQTFLVREVPPKPLMMWLTILLFSVVKHTQHKICHFNYFWIFSFVALSKIHTGDFPGGPVAKTLDSQYKVPRFDPWLGN